MADKLEHLAKCLLDIFFYEGPVSSYPILIFDCLDLVDLVYFWIACLFIMKLWKHFLYSDKHVN